MKKYLKLMRIHHYVKNVLIFIPLVFSGQLLNVSMLLPTIYIFIIFSLLSSAIYIINDIRDIEKDRAHSEKCKRPLASGAVSIPAAWTLTGILIAVCVVLYIFLIQSVIPASLLGLYLIINIGYSFGLKNYPIIDIVILVSGYLLRLLIGAAVVDITISNWLYLTAIGASFYMGFGKRRNELQRETDGTRKVLKFYNKDFLDKNMYLCLALAVVFYSLWCIDSGTIERIGTESIIWTIPIVLVMCIRYSLDIESGLNGDPTDVILKDKMLLALALIYAIFMALMLYTNWF